MFVGRKHELQRAHEAFERSAAGSGTLTVLSGEPSYWPWAQLLESLAQARLVSADALARASRPCWVTTPTLTPAMTPSASASRSFARS